MKLTRRTLAVLTGALLGGLAASASAQTKWDLPSAYPASNFHTENLAQFAKDVQAATGGKLTIQVHDNASLFKAPEIKRAVQTGNAQMGEFFLVSFQNESQIFGADGLPFLVSSYDEAFKLYQAQKPALQKLLDNDREKYEKFFAAFGPQIKYGVLADYGAKKETLQDLLLYWSSKEGKLISLKEYVAAGRLGRKTGRGVYQY